MWNRKLRNTSLAFMSMLSFSAARVCEALAQEAMPWENNQASSPSHPAKNAAGVVLKGTAIIRGNVVDGNTGQNLPGAKITATLTSMRNAPVRAASGAAGQFELRELPSGIYTITVSCVGYAAQNLANVKITAAETKALEIALLYTGILSDSKEVIASRNTEAFFETISASRRAESGFSAPASVNFVEAEQIQSRPALTPADQVQGLPGVDFSKHGLHQSNLVVRGFNNVFSGALLSLVDNRLTHVPALRYNASYFMSINHDDIERIEIVSGPGSALYGPNAANGVMQIITKSPFGSEGTSMSLGGGGRRLRIGSLRHAASFNNRFGYKISAQYYAGDDWEYHDPAEPDSFGRGGQKVASPGRDFRVQKFSADARVDIRPAENFTAVFSAGFSKNSGIDLTGIGAAQVKDWSYTYYQGRLYYKNLFAQAYLNRSDAGETFILRTGDPLGDKSRLFAAQAQHSFDIANRQRFTYGFDLLRTRPETAATINGRGDINETGAFLQSETSLGQKARLVLIGRYDEHNHLEKATFSPRGALILKPAQNHHLRFSYNRAFTTPSLQALLEAALPQQLAAVTGELRKLNPATGGFDLTAGVTAVQPLKPTITNSFEIGYKGLLAGKLFFAADLYRSRLQDFVGPLKVETPKVLVNAAPLPLGAIRPNEAANNTEVMITYRNFGNISLDGVEVSLNYYAGPKWILGANYSFVSEDLFKNVDGIGNIALNAPKHKIGMSLRHLNTRAGLEAQVRARYVGAFPVESGVYIGAIRNYTVVDLHVDYRFHRSTKLSLAAQNLLNKKHREIIGAPEIGRLLILRLTQSF